MRGPKNIFYGILGLALLARLSGAYFMPLWSDEFFTWRSVSQPNLIAFWLRVSGADVYPPLAYLPSYFLAKLSDSILMMRLPSVFAGVAAVGLTYHLALRAAGSRAALWAGLCAAILPLGVTLGWEAKPYEFLWLAELWIAHEVIRLRGLETHKPWRLGLALAASFYCHYSALIYFPIWILLTAKSLVTRKQFLQAWGLAIALMLPQAPFFIKTLLLYQGSSSSNEALLHAPWLSLANLAGGYWNPLGWSLAWAALLLLLWRLSRGQRQAWAQGHGNLLSWLAFAPGLLSFAASLAGKAVYNDKALLASASVFLILAAPSVQHPKAWVRGLALLLPLGLAFSLLRAYQPGILRADFAGPAQSIEAQRQDGDLVLHAYFESGLPAALATRSSHGVWQQWTWDAEPVFAQGGASEGVRALWRKFKERLSRHGWAPETGRDELFVSGPILNQKLGAASRVWLIMAKREALLKQVSQVPNMAWAGHPKPRAFDQAGRTWLEKGFVLREKRDLGDSELEFWEKKAKK